MAQRTTGNGTTTGRVHTANHRSAGNGQESPELAVKTNDKGQVWSHIRQKWLAETPEVRIRQGNVVALHNEYGFGLDQLDEEVHSLARRGSGAARADVVIWRTPHVKTDSKGA